MKIGGPLRLRRALTNLQLYSILALLMILWAVVAFQVQATLVYIGILVVQNPSLRPVGWNSSTIVGLSKCGILVLGAIWLGLLPFTEKYLREGLEDERLWTRIGRLLVVIGGIYGISAGLIYVLGRG